MKRKIMMLFVSLTLVAALTACGNNQTNNTTTNNGEIEIVEIPTVEEEPVVEEPTVVEVPEGMYRSELTNEIISEDLRNQRPIAAMVDNEITALAHYGVADADIVYELMNSLENGRITRLMVIVKDWKNIEQLGSVRSSRSTNFYLMWEYNAIFCHDGGPYYVEEFYDKEYTDHLNGIFSRVDNGKPREFTEYITSEDLIEGVKTYGISEEYNEFYEGPHFIFTDEVNQITFEEESYAKMATLIDLPYDHNGSYLNYNEEIGLYEYGEYGEPHIDALNDGNVTSFKNVIIQECTYAQLDDHGYMVYNVIDSGLSGFYCTNGKMIPITWEKKNNTDPTKYYNAETGEEIVLNTGKTYITLVPDDVWDELIIK